MRSALPCMLLVGNSRSPEMQPVAETVADLVPMNQLVEVADLSAVGQFIAENDRHPDLVIVCQSWPDEYRPDEVNRLLELLPLATILCCYGSWCDSDGRNRQIWPLAVRVPAFSSSALIRRLWRDAAEGNPPLPLTASREEIFARLHGEAIPADIGQLGTEQQARVCIESGDGAIREWLGDALQAAGFQIADNADAATAHVAVWDAPIWEERTAEELQQFHARCPSVPIVVLIGGMRPHQIDQARARGASCVLAKLTPVSTIVREIGAAICEVGQDAA